jgi:predicted DNA-binding protein
VTNKPPGTVDFKIYLRADLAERFAFQCESVGRKKSPLAQLLIEAWTEEMEQLEREQAQRKDSLD